MTNERRLSWYAVVWLDLQGQGSGLADLHEYAAKNGVNIHDPELKKRLIPTIEKVRGFRRVVDSLVETLCADRPIPPNKLSVKDLETFRKITRTKVKAEHLGDAAMLSVCLAQKSLKDTPLLLR